jgi:hypothetical protein
LACFFHTCSTSSIPLTYLWLYIIFKQILIIVVVVLMFTLRLKYDLNVSSSICMACFFYTSSNVTSSIPLPYLWKYV